MTTPPPVLKWTAQYSVANKPQSKLAGDKITLPQSALEQLLSAATVTVISEPEHSNSFDPFNPWSRAEHEASQVLERQQNLPHPLTFRLVNPANGHVVFAGIREFSANEEEVELSPFLSRALELEDGVEQKLTIHAQQLPKGTFVRFRPLEAGYDPEDWKALLERQLRNSFTTITRNEILKIQSGKDEYRFLVDEVKPEGDGICIIDTDLEVDIEALNEEQARETLKRRLEKSAKPIDGDSGSSGGGEISIGTVAQGRVIPGEYVDYTLTTWDLSKGLEVMVEASEPGTLDLFVSPFSRLQRSKPRQEEHFFSVVSEDTSKTILIRPTNSALDGAESLYISLHGHGTEPSSFSIQVRNETSKNDTVNGERMDVDEPLQPDEVRCKNCQQTVPQRTMVLHESFCYRNNVFCPKCKNVFQKSSSEWQNHWHCPHDESYGSSLTSKSHHDDFFHTETACKSCGSSESSISALAQHRTTTCPEKQILCQFCHLIVPQQGPEDLDVFDPEVVLSGLTPHELADGGSTTDCHMCGKIVRLKDMQTHLRHHDLDRLSRPTPRLCRNINCGKTLDGVGPGGQIRQPRGDKNDLGLCDSCFGPLYNSSFDPDHKQLKRRVERRYLTQLLTGCGNDWCQNKMCKSGKTHIGLEPTGMTSKDALTEIKPILTDLLNLKIPLSFCVDESSEKRRIMADMIAEDASGGEGYRLPWTIAAMEATNGDLDEGRRWLSSWAPKVKEETS